MARTTSRIPLALTSSLPSHRMALSALLLGTLLVAVGLIGSGSVEANRASIPIRIATVPTAISAQPLNVERTETPTTYKTVEAEVRRGDTLSVIFGRSGLQRNDMQQVLDADGKSRSLQNLFPGQGLSFLVNQDGTLQELRYAKSPLETVV